MPDSICAATSRAASISSLQAPADSPYSLAVVGDRDRFGHASILDDDENGTEDLLLRDRHPIVDVGENSWAEPVSGIKHSAAQARATESQCCAFLRTQFDVVLDALTLFGRDDRSHIGIEVVWITYTNGGRAFDEPCDEFVVQRFRQQQACT